MTTTTAPATAALPLTTVFTPPATCDNFSWISSDCLGSTCKGVYNIVRATETECFPSGWATSATTFSPGLVCPSGYSIAGTTLASFGAASIETRATCCPSGFSVAASSPLAWYTSEPCIRTTDVATTITFNVVGVTPTTTTVYTWASPVYHARAVGLAWQSSDTISTSVDIMPTTATTATAKTTANDSGPAATSPGATTSVASSAGGSSSGLSTGAKAGIGVGVSVGVLAIALAFGVFFWLRRRRAHGSLEQVPSEYGSTRKTASHGRPTELEDMSSTSGATELPAEVSGLHELKG